MAQAVEIEDVLDVIAIVMKNLDAIREKVEDDTDRRAIASQVIALGKWWRKLDVARLAQPDERLKSAKDELHSVAGDLKTQKRRLTQVAKVIHGAARAIAIAEKIAKLAII